MGSNLDRLRSHYDSLRQQLRQEKSKLAEAEQRETDTLSAQQLVQAVAEGIQQTAHHQLAKVVTRCLKAVFGEEAYTFKINFVKKRGRTEAELCFVRNGTEMNPSTASGGGIVDIAAFSLRIACLMLSMPKNRRLLVLDEPMRMLSSKHRPIAAQLLKTLATELKIQIVLVTHHEEFKGIGSNFEVEQ